MKKPWIANLIRARQFHEDNARAHVATAERLASRAHARVRYDQQRLESLRDAGAEANAASFVAAAVARQAAAATYAAAVSAAEQAERDIHDSRNQLTEAAVARRSAEELAARAAAAEAAKAAAADQRKQDEIAATVYRHQRDDGNGPGPNQ